MIKRQFFISLCSILILLFISGCDYGIRTIAVEFVQPPRVVYIAGVDNELDFSGVTWMTIHADGHQNESPFPELPCRWITVEHNVDFNVPGIYKVKILRPNDIHLAFFVQVIDAEIFRELSGRYDEGSDNPGTEEE